MGSHTLTVGLIVDSPTFHYLLQPGSAGLRDKKGIFPFLLKKMELDLYQAESLNHLTKTKTVFIVVFVDLPTHSHLAGRQMNYCTYIFCNKVHKMKGTKKKLAYNKSVF